MKEGLYESIINEKIHNQLQNLQNINIQKEKLSIEESKNILSKYMGEVIRQSLTYIREDYKSNQEKEALLHQINSCNKIIDLLSTEAKECSLNDYKIEQQAEMLMSLYSKINSTMSVNTSIKTIRPTTPLSESSLFTGASIEPSMIDEMKKEIVTCDSIDMLVSFIRWSGLRMIIEELREFVKLDNHKVRIITTSYMGATEYKAIEELSKLRNVEVKISYDTERTRLHAKAYMFRRETGFTTAYVGSSNMSNPAMTSGLEWNIKISEKDSFEVVKKFQATFESYWNDGEFILFNNEVIEDRNRLKVALSKANNRENEFDFNLDIRPYHYQQEILEQLRAEREIFNKNRNLVVAATGVGKTVISAFDYKNFVKSRAKEVNRLLFVAHREEILKQSLNTFRAILKDSNFGDLLVGKYKPESIDHLFISIQSFNSIELFEKTTEDYYDFIIVDEFHHAKAPTYEKLLNYYNPKILLGLTATPERMDGKNVLEHFDDRIASELRLTEAINRKLLSPFQYFCIGETVDLSKVKWGRRGYSIEELSNVYTNNDMRSIQVLNSIDKYVSNINEVKGLGFCVSVDHAIYMANFFNEKGISSIAIHGKSNDEQRESAQKKLVQGDIKFIFVVDLYNEGIDIPEVNTILFLRPTESLTVFLQQLGRGLRLHENKECLTVLDFIGQAHKNYNFEDKFKSIMGSSRHSLEYSIKNGFINIPKGCYISLDKTSKDYVLRNLRSASNSKQNLISRMKTFEADTGMELTIKNFKDYYNLSYVDIYGKNIDRTFSSMKAKANGSEISIDESSIKKLKNLFHINSRRFIKNAINIINNICNISMINLTEEEKIITNMLYYTFYNNHPAKEGFSTVLEGINKFLNIDYIKNEVLDILNYNYRNIKFVDKHLNMGFMHGLDIHCVYTKDQILAALNNYNELQSPEMREGVKYIGEKNLDIFFITLNKSEKDFSPSTLYDDYAISETLFHWQSQSRTSVESPTGQRYINHMKLNSKIILFVREYKKEEGITSPYMYLGEAVYIKHEGNRPISFMWELKEAMPASMFKKANKSIV